MGEHLFERLARERNITVEEMRAIISARIEKGMNDPDPEKRAQWEKIPRAGEIPTPEEWLKYAVETLEAEGRGDLLTFKGCAFSRCKGAVYRMRKKKRRICTPYLVLIRCFCIR